jgi:hypothetical protein
MLHLPVTLIFGFGDFARCVRCDDVSGAAVGTIFNGHKLEYKRAAEWDAACTFTLQFVTIEDGIHSGSQNVVKKFTLHTVQNPQNQKSVFIPP